MTVPIGAADRAADDRFARERRLTIVARHGQSVRRRWAFGVLGIAIGVGDAWLDYFPTRWFEAIVPALLLVLANAWCVNRVRAGRVREWHFWTMLVLDVTLIAATCALAGSQGTVGMPFLVVVAAAYGLGLPQAARVHLALSAALYPIARLLGGAPAATIALETVCLSVLSWLAIASPMRFTHRLHRARQALGALERGDFSVRLPTRALDDLGFLAVSYNSSAEALGAAVEELRRSREALAHQAEHDPLTGLANRIRFADRLDRALAGPHPERVAVIMVDLDGFKGVNDRLGHAAGDRLLAVVAARLLNATRGCDTVARLGGDEFAVLLENVGAPHDAEVVAERILETLGSPAELEGTTVDVSASLGVAHHVAGERPDAIVRRADAAMYEAKGRGKARYVVHGAPPRPDPGAGRAGARWMLV